MPAKKDNPLIGSFRAPVPDAPPSAGPSEDKKPAELPKDAPDPKATGVTPAKTAKMFHFLYGEGWPLSQRQMRRERCFTKADYIEFASLRDGLLSRYRPIREVTFAGKPFVPPKAYRRMHRERPAPTR